MRNGERDIKINKCLWQIKMYRTEETIKSSAASVLFCNSFERTKGTFCKESPGPIDKKTFIRLKSHVFCPCEPMQFHGPL